LSTVLSRKAMPEPIEAAAITQGREDGRHSAEARVHWMTPASQGWRMAAITGFVGSGTAQRYFDACS
jgi:hypothetical protein